jgi:hypothetical protein
MHGNNKLVFGMDRDGLTHPLRVDFDGRLITIAESAGCVPASLTLIPSIPALVQGVPYRFNFNAAGTGPLAYAITAGTLPDGLTLYPASGILLGTPTGAGAYDFTVTATNPCGSSNQQYTGTISAGCVPVRILSADLPDPSQGIAYTFTILSSGTGPKTWTLASGTLPAGLSLNGSTGVISGTPTVSGPYRFEIAVSNACGSDRVEYDGVITGVCVSVAITSGDPPNPTVGVFYTFTFTATGTGPRTWSVAGGSLPLGITLNSATGVISGIPTTSAGYSWDIQVSNPCPSSANRATGVVVSAACVPVVITTPSIATPVIGVAYSASQSASGTAPVTWSISAGALPTGLTLNTSTGAITGTPTTPGAYTFTSTATNACGVANMTYSGTIAALPPPTAFTARYGKIIWPGAPAAVPTFTAVDFTGPSPLFEVAPTNATPASGNGTYVFPPRTTGANIRQVLWLADSLTGGSPNFVASGFPWGLDPSANTHCQALTIAGVPGKVYCASDVNNGEVIVIASGMIP